MKKKSIYVGLLLATSALALTSCNFGNQTNPGETPPVEQDSLTSIAVVTSGAKTAYNLGEAFSAEGLVVNATYSQTGEKAVTGYIVDSATVNKDAVGTYTITISFEGKTATYEVTYADNNAVTSLKVTGASEEICKVGETYVPSSDVKIYAVKKDGTETLINHSDATFAVDTTTENEEAVCTVTYNGVTATFKVDVYMPVVTNLEVQVKEDLLLVAGTEFDKSLVKVVATYDDASTEDVTNKATFDIDMSKPNKDGLTVTYAGATESIDATVLEKVEITTAEQLNAFRTSTEGDKAYFLMNDIDLEGVDLEDTTVKLTGLFEGNGHTIKNASLNTTGAKLGILVATNSGVIRNVKFLNCAISSTSESVAIVAGLADSQLDASGNVTNTVKFTGIEFNSCSASTTNNYVGLVFARNTAKSIIEVDQITAKNGSYTANAQYGGFVMGDMVASTKVTLTNMKLEGEFKNCSGNGSIIAGRTRGGSVVEKNIIVNVKYSGTADVAKIPYFTGNSSVDSLEVENVIIIQTNLTRANLNNKAPKVSSYKNVIMVTNTTEGDLADISDNVTKKESITNAELETLGFDFENTWMVEGDSCRLVASSTNLKSADATISQVKISTANATVRFHAGEDFTADGLLVSGVYSDGVQLVLGTDGYTIDSTEYNKDVAGNYTITVKSVEDETKLITYTVRVVEQTGFEFNNEFVDKVFLVGEKFNSTNLKGYSIWDDGIKEATELTVNSDGYDKNTAGKYTISVTDKNASQFAAQTYAVSVIESAPLVNDNKVAVNVNASTTLAYEGIRVDGVESFTSLANALTYLAKLKYADEVEKVVFIGAGEYREKITTSLANLKLIGTGDTEKDTKIIYNAVESTVNITNGAIYGLSCATFEVNGAGFTATNISFINDFNYAYNQYDTIVAQNKLKESSPQGLALTINGDRAVLTNVYLYGNQDTLYIKSGRCYIKNSEIAGNVDFIFGMESGIVYFDNCKIVAVSRTYDSVNNKEYKETYTVKADVTADNFVANTLYTKTGSVYELAETYSAEATYYTKVNGDNNNGYVTAMRVDNESDKPKYGYIFDHCEFTDDGKVRAGAMSLGRPWGQYATVSMINCSFSAAYSKLAYDGSAKSRWFDMSGYKPAAADFAEFGSTGDGAITEAVAGGKVLTETEAGNYTAANMFGAENSPKYKTAWDYSAALAAVATYTAERPTTGTLTVAENSLEVTVDETVDLGASVTWNALNKDVAVTVDDPTVATVINGVVTGLKAGTTTITVTYGSVEKQISLTVKANQNAQATVTYTYAYGGTNDTSWVEDYNGTCNSSDSPAITCGKIVPGKSLTLTTTATKKATLSLKGFTTGSSNASAYLSVKFLDADGNEVAAKTGTSGTGKAVAPWTVDGNATWTVETTTAFTTIVFTSNTDNKSIAITEATVVIEL